MRILFRKLLTLLRSRGVLSDLTILQSIPVTIPYKLLSRKDFYRLLKIKNAPIGRLTQPIGVF